MAIAGVLLTGGASRRMGAHKARLVVAGESLARRAARVLTEVCAPVVEVGPGDSGLPSTREDPPGAGPLAGLVAGWEALDRPGRLLLFAVDLPRVGVPLLRLLATREGPATVVPVAGGALQPVCARYGRAALVAAGRELAAGRGALRSLLAATPHGVLPEAEWRTVAAADSFAGVDTPADLAALLRAYDSARGRSNPAAPGRDRGAGAGDRR